jgi:asparagine synthase (glutamine-hydrolysing)
VKAFLAVSYAPQVAHRLRRPDLQALARLHEGDAVESEIDEFDDGWAAFVGRDAHDILPRSEAEPGAEAGRGFTVRLSRTARTRERDVRTADLPSMIADAPGLTALLPPFAAAHRAGPGAPIVVAGDWLGFRQIYWWRGAGVAAISTSARALSVLAGGGYDLAGLGAQAMIGWQVGDTTIFDGVRTLGPATIATLRAGSLELRQYADPPVNRGRPQALEDAVDEMASILVASLTSYLEQHPESVLQLTGGHDSRILLAAIPEKMRGDLDALTLGERSHPDVAIAARLSARYGMRHQVHNLEERRWPSPPGAHGLALTAARALECLASPLALAPLLLAESSLSQGHRLSGLGGEVARGFYYSGQPTGATTSPQLVDRLARWRLFINEAVAADAIDPAFLADARETTLTTLRGLFAPGDWLRATDEFYLLHRMHRWAGAHGSVAAVRRHFINPMFDRRFIELALAVAPSYKRDSLLLGRLVERLDPELASVPLDSGLAPRRLADPSVATRLAAHALTARRVVRKVRQRVTGGRRPQFGAAHTSALVLAHWRAEPQACAALYDVPVLRRDWLDALLAGHKSADPTTVAFLVNIVAAGEGRVPSAKVGEVADRGGGSPGLTGK